MDLEHQACVKDRARSTAAHLLELGAIPVLTLGVTVDTQQLVILGYNSKTQQQIEEMLKDFLEAVGTAKNITI